MYCCCLYISVYAEQGQGLGVKAPPPVKVTHKESLAHFELWTTGILRHRLNKCS